MACENHCNNGLTIIIVLYILLAIIIGAAIRWQLKIKGGIYSSFYLFKLSDNFLNASSNEISLLWG